MNENLRMHLIREFFFMISANTNSASIYHGLESILQKDELPQFMIDNMSESKIIKMLMEFGSDG